MNLDDLSPELLEKLKACTTQEELLTLAKEAGVTFSDEELEGISGGVSDECRLDIQLCNGDFLSCVKLFLCPNDGPSCSRILQ